MYCWDEVLNIVVLFVLFPALLFCLAMMSWHLYQQGKKRDEFAKERDERWRRNGWIK